MPDDGVQKSAILLMSLGEEEAAEVFQHLAPLEVQKIGATMASLKSPKRDEVKVVLDEFQSQAGEQSPMALGGNDYVKSVLKKALGDDRAAPLIERILQGGDTSGIDGLKWMESSAVAELIRNEHPQIVAAILVHLDRDQASEVLAHCNERLRNDVLLRIATLDGIQPTALKELNDVLAKLLLGEAHSKKGAMGGVRAAAEILNFMAGAAETSVIESVQEHDPELAQKIMDEMFVWEDLLEMDNKGFQVMLREVQSDSLLLALKGSSPELREKVFANMSQRAAETLREDLETRGMVKLSEVEAQQKEILKIVRRLMEEGQITVASGNGEAYV